MTMLSKTKNIDHEYYDLAKNIKNVMGCYGQNRALFYKNGEFKHVQITIDRTRPTKYDKLLESHYLVNNYDKNVKIKEILEDIDFTLEG